MEKEEQSAKQLDPDELWMIRPCDQYHEEYKECRRFRARLFQHFVNGKVNDCDQWRLDRNNCLQWESQRDATAAHDIIKSEKKRRVLRLGPHIKNSVWEKRDSPPEDWNKPLPDFMERNKFSYISRQMRIERGEPEIPWEDFKQLASKTKLCVIQ